MAYLIGFDGSEESYRTLEYAVDLVTDTGASLVAIHVVGPAVFDIDHDSTSFGRLPELIARDQLKVAKRRSEQMLENAADVARDRGTHLDTQLVYGHLVEHTLTTADEHDIDALFVGHRSRKDRPERFLGSVSKGIAVRATVPATVVR